MYKKRFVFAFILLSLALMSISVTSVLAQATVTITVNFTDLVPSDADNLMNASKYYLEFGNGLGNHGAGAFTATLDSLPKNVSYRARTDNLYGPWLNLTIDSDEVIDYTYVAFDASLDGADSVALTDSQFYLDFGTSLGNLYDNGGLGGTLYIPAGTNPNFLAHTGALYGPWTPVANVGVDINYTSGPQTLNYRYVAFKANLHHESTVLSTDLYYLQFGGSLGNQYDDDNPQGGILYTPVGANPSFLAHTGALYGAWTPVANVGVNTSNTSNLQTLDYQYVAFNANLHHESTVLSTDLYYLQFGGSLGNQYDNDNPQGGILYTPVGANPSFLAHTGSLYGAWTALADAGISINDPSSVQTLDYQYVAFNANLFNGDEALSTDLYYLQFGGSLGNQYDNDNPQGGILYTPVGANPSFLAHTGSLYGSWTTLASTGVSINDPSAVQTLNYEYVSFKAYLHNNGVELTDSIYYLQFGGSLGNVYSDGTVMHTPIGANPSFLIHTGNLYGAWTPLNSGIDITAGAAPNVPNTPGVQTLEIEYATVVFTFQPALPANLANMMSTQVSGVGLIANNGTVHLPPNTNISFRAQRGSWYTPWYTQSFDAGDGTVYWGIRPTYVPES